MPEPVLFRGARVIDPASGTDEVADLHVDGGVIAPSPGSAATVLDCDGLVLAPGLVDLHAHLRQPGREDKETVESGCRAAALGGFTAVSSMANTDPVADNAAVIHQVLELARAAGTCDVFPVGAITRGLGGEEMAELGEMVDAGVRLFSDDGRSVPKARLLRNALTYVRAFEDVVIAEHCEDASLAEGGQMHEGLTSSSLGLAGQPREAEEVVVARDLAIARLTGGRLHLCHLSSAGSVVDASEAPRPPPEARHDVPMSGFFDPLGCGEGRTPANSASFSSTAWGAWSVATASIVPSSSPALSPRRSSPERSGGFVFMFVS